MISVDAKPLALWMCPDPGPTWLPKSTEAIHFTLKLRGPGRY